MPQNIGKSIRERSPFYPSYSLLESVELIKEINIFGGDKLSLETVSAIINLSVKTNSFGAKISSAKQFGLLQGSNGVVQITPLAMRIIKSMNGSEKKTHLYESFLKVKLYCKIIKEFQDKQLPPKERLGDYISGKYGISTVAKRIAASKFIESAEQIEILKNGKIVLNPEFLEVAPSELFDEPENLLTTMLTSEPKTDFLQTVDDHPNDDSEYISYPVPFKSGKIAEIKIPTDATEEDLIIMNDIFSVILKRKFKIEL